MTSDINKFCELVGNKIRGMITIENTLSLIKDIILPLMADVVYDYRSHKGCKFRHKSAYNYGSNDDGGNYCIPEYHLKWFKSDIALDIYAESIWNWRYEYDERIELIIKLINNTEIVDENYGLDDNNVVDGVESNALNVYNYIK